MTPTRGAFSRGRPLLLVALLPALVLAPAACRARHRQALPPAPVAEAPSAAPLATAQPEHLAGTSQAPRLPTPDSSGGPRLEGTATALALAVATAGRLATEAAAPPPARPAATAIRQATPPSGGPPAGALGLGQGAKGGRLGAIYRLEGLRQGEHAGFTRLVWQLSAEPAAKDAEGPLWEIIQEANQAEPKAAALLEGCCHIRLRLADTYAQDYVGALSLSPAPGGPVRGTRLLPMEDDSSLTFAIDLAEAAPYTVTVLQDPLRVVVDVYRP